MRLTFLVLASLVAVNAEPFARHAPERIVGGSIPSIGQYPFAAALLRDLGGSYVQFCVGSILNNRSILTAAHCFVNTVASVWRIRVGSIFASSGGTVHTGALLISHPGFNITTGVNNIGILRSATIIAFTANTVQPASIAGPNYVIPDNQPVWAIGWGAVVAGGPSSEQLRHVQLFSINQAFCSTRINFAITDSMLCAGGMDFGGRGQCSGDDGGPLLHNNVVIGVFFSEFQCGVGLRPGVNTRVSHFTAWILGNA